MAVSPAENPRLTNVTWNAGQLNSWLMPCLVGVLAFVYGKLAASGVLNDFANNQYDDSYITYRYALNLAHGLGMVFNAGDFTNSASSLLWTLILVPGASISSDLVPSVAREAGIVSFAITAGCIAAVVVRSSDSVWRWAMAAVAATIWASNAYSVFWSVSGMETAFFCAFIAIAMLGARAAICDLAAQRTVRWRSLAVLSIPCVIRPEGIALSVSLAMVVFFYGLQAGRPTRWRQSLIPLATVLGVTIALACFYFVYYKSVIPDPVSFKRVARYYSQTLLEAIEAGRDFLTTSVGAVTLGLCFLGIVAVWLDIRTYPRDPNSFIRALGPVALFALGAFTLMAAHADFFRYHVPLLVPLAVTASMFPISRAVNHDLDQSKVLKRLFGGLVMTASIGLVLSLAVAAPSRLAQLYGATSQYGYLQRERIELGKYLEETLPPGSRVLSGDLGALAFYNSSSEFVDISGLTNRSLIDGLKSGVPYQDLILARRPSFLADTVNSAGITGSEEVFDEPSRYFVHGFAASRDGCSFSKAFDARPLVKRGAISEGELGVTAFAIREKSDCRD